LRYVTSFERTGMASMLVIVMIAGAAAAPGRAGEAATGRPGSGVSPGNPESDREIAMVDDVVAGNGRIRTEERQVPPSSSIQVDGSFEVAVTAGSPQKLVVEADENLLPIIKTVVSGKELRIYSDRSFASRHAVRITFSTPSLSRLSASGSTHIAATGLVSEDFSLSLDGSSEVELNGRIARLTCESDGSTELSAESLITDAARIDFRGAGQGSFTVRENLDAEISGAAAITIYGHPKQRRTHIGGAGSIDFAEE
jgi:hypothetical protein